MSGGHFEYAQYHIDDIVSSIERYVYGRDIDDVEEYLNYNTWLTKEEADYIREHKRTLPNVSEFDDETIALFKKGIEILKEAEVYAQRIDWLLSGDDGEDSFKKRLKEELEKLKTENNDTIRSIEE